MYKCSECGKTFNQKPDYCDCGNDTFEIIAENNPPKAAPSYIRSAQQNTVSKSSVQGSIDKKSVLILALCIILSIISLLFIDIGPDEDKTTSENKAANNKIANKNIPSIDEIWIESKIKKTTNTVANKQEPQSIPIVSDVINTYNNVKNQISAPVQKSNVYRQQPSTPAYNTYKPSSTVKKKTTSVNKAAAPKKTVTKTTSSNTNVKTNTSNKSNATPAKQSSSVTKTVSTKPSVQPAVNTAAMQKEYQNYKIGLRNKIASNINFVNVVGDGSCVISFKIDSSGNLVNRAFSQQSINDSLNDAVYSAMMNTPSYKTPPAAYKNQTLKLSVKMSGGNFEVNLY